MATAEYRIAGRRARSDLVHQLRILRVFAGIEFKMKYADSVLGYVWSFAKPLSYFAVLWLIFGHFIRLGGGIANFPVYLLLGIVLYTFFTDAVGMALPAIAGRGSLLRRLAFSALVLPVSMTITACITFAINAVAALLIATATGVRPQLDWILLLLLAVELYAFILGIALILTTLFVRLRDIAQIWELAAQLLIFASPVMYPLEILPEWAQRIAFVSPLVQVMQDVREIVLGSTVTVVDIYGTFGHTVPLLVAAATLAVGLALFRRDAPYFAERV